AAALAVYGALSWAALARFHGQDGRADLGLLFLVLDLAFVLAAIHETGGERSGLFFMLVVRVAAEAADPARRVFAGAHLAGASDVRRRRRRPPVGRGPRLLVARGAREDGARLRREPLRGPGPARRLGGRGEAGRGPEAAPGSAARAPGRGQRGKRDRGARDA